jgi:hypothetical protein
MPSPVPTGSATTCGRVTCNASRERAAAGDDHGGLRYAVGAAHRDPHLASPRGERDPCLGGRPAADLVDPEALPGTPRDQVYAVVAAVGEGAAAVRRDQRVARGVDAGGGASDARFGGGVGGTVGGRAAGGAVAGAGTAVRGSATRAEAAGDGSVGATTVEPLPNGWTVRAVRPSPISDSASRPTVTATAAPTNQASALATMRRAAWFTRETIARYGIRDG